MMPLPARSNNMTPRIPEEFSTRLIDWSPFVIMGNTIPPRDHPDEDEEDEEEEDRADEPPVVREPDED
jgi:GTPase SAR1 family protein